MTLNLEKINFRALLPQTFNDKSMEKLISGFQQLKIAEDEICGVELDKCGNWEELTPFQKQNMPKVQNLLNQGISR